MKKVKIFWTEEVCKEGTIVVDDDFNVDLFVHECDSDSEWIDNLVNIEINDTRSRIIDSVEELIIGD